MSGRQCLLRNLQVCAETVDVVDPGGGTDRLRVLPQPFDGAGVFLDLLHQLQDCADVGMVSDTGPDVSDLFRETGVDRQLVLRHLLSPREPVKQDCNNGQEDNCYDEQGVFDGHDSPFLRCALAPSVERVAIARLLYKNNIYLSRALVSSLSRRLCRVNRGQDIKRARTSSGRMAFNPQGIGLFSCPRGAGMGRITLVIHGVRRYRGNPCRLPSLLPGWPGRLESEAGHGTTTAGYPGWSRSRSADLL